LEGLKLFITLNILQELENIVLDSYHKSLSFSDSAYHERVDYHSILATIIRATGEGTFIGDGLFRRYQNYHRRQYQSLVGNMYSNSNKLKLAYKLDTTYSNALETDDTETKNLPREVVFDDGDYLCQNAITTNVGDIYEVTSRGGEKRYFILLTQPCGLTVRSDGGRAGNPTVFSLVEIKEGKPHTTQVEVGRSHQLDASPIGAWENAFVDFRIHIYVKPSILDLCVFNEAGEAILQRDIQMRDNIIESGWGKLLEELNSWISAIFSRHDNLFGTLSGVANNADRENLEQSLLESYFGIYFSDDTIKVTREGNTIAVGIKRIGRLVEAHSIGLIIDYARYQSRPGYPNPVV
jgi:hypothetical protein